MGAIYLPPGWSARERKRAVRALMRGPRRLELPGDRVRRWSTRAVLLCAIAQAIAAAALLVMHLKGDF